MVLAAATPSLGEDGTYGKPLLDIDEDPTLPPDMRHLMERSRAHYLEGLDLMRTGEVGRARTSFDSAVDLLLESHWGAGASPSLNRFFMELIRRIREDEAGHHRTLETEESGVEGAVVDELESLDLFTLEVDPSLMDLVEADLLSTKYDIPVVLNEKVFKSLNYWLGRGKRYFTDGLVRSGRYLEMIQAIFREENIPQDVLYLAQVESLFKTNAYSRARARGIWQFTVGTGTRYGLKVNGQIDERSDPEKSTRAAARYLKDLYAMFGDWNLVLAAYNWGEGRVQKLVDRSGLNDFWSLTELKRNFPKETQNHVPLIMASIILGRNPQKYGLPEQLDPPLRYDRVVVPKRISLSAAAKALDVPVDSLKELNPALKSAYTPSGYPDFELRIPLGLAPEVLERLALVPESKAPAVPAFNGKHKVLPGETLGGIAAKYRTTVSALQLANNIQSPKSLRAGTWIQVPPPSAPAKAAPARPAKASAGK